ncbi:transcription cofactor vestigial-like protein 1 isoform X4 [Cinclus cinclus]|uniref:transcription cofactor vestigial-like protein 1 isoform X4 n=1 Tax=Cinclus cinclus TaxID=127875 RepID=UPI002E0D936C
MKMNAMFIGKFLRIGGCMARDCWSLKMEETRKPSPKPSKSKEPVKTEWGSQSVVFTYFQGDINSMVDQHFSRALGNVKNPEDLSTKHKDSMCPHQWNFSSHCYKPSPSSSSASMANSALNFSAAAVVGQCQPSSLQSRPVQPADLWPFPPTGTPSVMGSVYPHTPPDLHAADELISDRKYSSLLGLLQQERCLTSMQECTMKQHSSSACITGPARLQNMSQSSALGGERKASSYQGSENPSVSHATAGIQIHDRRQDLYF